MQLDKKREGARNTDEQRQRDSELKPTRILGRWGKGRWRKKELERKKVWKGLRWGGTNRLLVTQK